MAKSSRELEISYLPPSEKHPLDPWHLFIRNVPWMIKEARRIRLEQSASYRIRVGGLLIATNPLDHSVGIYTGANSKINPASNKVCSEKRATRRAEKDLRNNFIAAVVSGDPQPDDGSLLESDTLHCCEVCREDIVRPKFNPDTLILTVHPDENKYQLQISEELLGLHDAAAARQDPIQPPTFSFPRRSYWETSTELYESRLRRAGITAVTGSIEQPQRLIVVNAAIAAITSFERAA